MIGSWPHAAPSPAGQLLVVGLAPILDRVGPETMMTVEPLAQLLAGRRTVILTGAGISTDSGIPDYRGDGAPRRAPMQYAEFRSDHAARVRYWARSHLGWRRVAAAEPNDGHRAVAELERMGVATAVITQNVDGLHTRAGSRRVVELHGRLADVVCLSCGDRCDRDELHVRLERANPGFAAQAAAFAPDGDADLADVADFRIVGCRGCGGVLKPDVVFFGEAVPPNRVAACFTLVDMAEVMLVAGSSLAVLSGFRFVRRAHARGIPIAIVNRGPTRADRLATIRLDTGCSEALRELAHSVA